MNLDDVAILTDQEVKGICHDVYNGFWLRYRDNSPDLQSPEWEEIAERERMLRERYNSCPLVLHMIQDLMDQLEARSRRRKHDDKTDG